MRQVADLICAERASGTSMLRPAENAGFEKSAIEDQLPSALE
jgi:hypothetical protein